MSKDPSEQTPAQAAAPTPPGAPRRVLLVPYPKVIFLYPTFVVCIVAAVCIHYQRFVLSVINCVDQSPADGQAVVSERIAASEIVPVVLTIIFLYVLAVNLVVLAFDFPRASFLTLFFFFAMVALTVTLVLTLYPGLRPAALELLRNMPSPKADAAFFACVSLILGLIFVGVFISVRFNYWEVRPNELLHHHGILSDLKRFAAPSIRVDKEINDVFEYMLLGSGRLILQPAGTRRAIILDNVPLISRKERQITKMLAALQVDLRQDDSAAGPPAG